MQRGCNRGVAAIAALTWLYNYVSNYYVAASRRDYMHLHMINSLQVYLCVFDQIRDLLGAFPEVI